MTRSIAVVTVARSDYGIYQPLLAAIERSSSLSLKLVAGGSHTVASHGETIREIEAGGFPVAARIDAAAHGDSPLSIAESAAAHVRGFAQAFDTLKPEIIVVLGDRYEMHAAAVAAVPFDSAVVHLHGGEISEGAFDDALRHSITKLSHLHFVATTQYARRVKQMGEEPWRITVSGAPALDALTEFAPLSDAELERLVGMSLDDPPIVVTFHPATREWRSAPEQVRALLNALAKMGKPVVFTAPNADTGRNALAATIEGFVKDASRATFVASLGQRGYFSLLRRAVAMAGNSSSGLIEAPSFELPVVNVGSRQDGRMRAANVIDCSAETHAIVEALEKACSKEFRDGLRGLENPFGDGHASARIVRVLEGVALDDSLLRKRFVDDPA